MNEERADEVEKVREAAPDLLFALEAMLDDYEDLCGLRACECDSSVGLTCNPCRARAAIAKAGKNRYHDDSADSL